MKAMGKQIQLNRLLRSVFVDRAILDDTTSTSNIAEDDESLDDLLAGVSPSQVGESR
jgi:hypothetical protein